MCDAISPTHPEIQCSLGRTPSDHAIHSGVAWLHPVEGLMHRISDVWENTEYVPQVVKTRNSMVRDGLKLASAVPPERRASAVARSSDPETSHQAAAKLGDLTSAQDEVIELLRQYGPSTDDEILRRARALGLKQTDSGLRTRRSELEQAGLVEWSGERRLNERGNQSRVWRLVEEVPGSTLS